MMRGITGTPSPKRPAKASLTHPVYCHACEGNPRDLPVLRRCDAVLHGSDTFGGLWHCPKHAHCGYCAHDPHYCDPECTQGKRRHHPDAERGA